MSDCSTPCDTSPSGEQEPTMVSVPVVGSGVTDEMANSWETGTTLAAQENTNLCSVSPLNNSSVDPAVSLTSVNQMPSAISHSEAISQEGNTPVSFIHSGIIHDADSTSGSLGMCEEERMIIDRPLQSGTSVSTIVSHEPMSVSQDSDNSEEDHMTVMDNIAAQNFLRETDLLNAATSALSSEKSSMTDNVIGKSNITHNLISSLEHHSSTHDSEPMEMQNLLHDHSDLDGQVPSMPGYHLDHSQTSDLSCGNSSELHIGRNSVRDMQTESICFSSSSASNTSDLSSGPCISSGVGLPPVSTIIRSSAAKGRFDAFCRPSNINMIMDMPSFLNSSSSYDAMTSMSAIQRIGTDHCDGLTAVSLTSPLDVSSSRHNTCTDIGLENVDVPLSSVCSTTSSDLISVGGSRCIKPTSSVMSTLGPDIMDKQSTSLSEMAESQMQPNDNLNLPLTSTSSIPPFPGVIPIRDIINLGGGSQVSLLSSMRLDEIQKVAAIREHLRSEATSEETLAHSIMSPHFNCRGDIQHSETFTEDLSHTPQSLPLLSVSAIETNVIMSTSNAESGSKLSSSEMKVIESSKRMTDQQLQNLEAISQQLENSAIQAQVIGKNVESSRTSNIVFSTVQNVLSSHHDNSAVVFTTSSGSLNNQKLISRSSIIERNVVQHPQTVKRTNTNISTIGSEAISPERTAGSPLLHSKDEEITSSIKPPKLEEKVSGEGRQRLSTVSPSAATASVIQQLLKAQVPNIDLKPTMQRVSGGVITSVTSAKSEFNAMSRVSELTSPSSVKQEVTKVKQEIGEELSDEPVTTDDNPQSTLLISVGSNDKLQLRLSEDSLDIPRDKSPELSASTGKESSTLPNLSAVALPSFFSNLSASAIASLHSSLKSTLPVTLPTSLPSITISGTGTSVSLLSSFQPGFVSSPISAVPSIILPNILSSTLRNATSGIKSSDSLPTTSLSSSNSNVYSGLLKSVGLPTIVKQEPQVDGNSAPLPPFTVVSGLSPLVKREFSSNLASSFLNSNNASSQIPVLTIKHEPGSKQSSASASDFAASSVLNASSTLPSVATVQIPSSTPLELSVVVACSTAATTMPTSPVPSQASTIAFAGNALAVVSSATTAAALPASSAKQEDSSEKKWNCTMCKNGSPCGLHPIQSQGSSTSSQGAPPPPLLSGDPAKPFQCTLCGKHLASKNVYQLHLRSHSGEKPFTCNLCGHHFSQKTSLTRHMRSHTGERPFPCEACGKRFADKERIKIHMRTHTGEKPFACEVCGKRFSQKSTVKRHMSVHTGEKPFKCETCGKGFANRGNLNAHSKTHANT